MFLFCCSISLLIMSKSLFSNWRYKVSIWKKKNIYLSLEYMLIKVLHIHDTLGCDNLVFVQQREPDAKPENPAPLTK